MTQKKNKSRPFLSDIRKAVEDYFQVGIRTSARNKEVVVAKQLFCFISYVYYGYSYPKIAKHIGYKDHTSAMHSVEKYQDDLESIIDGEKWKKQLNTCLLKINASSVKNYWVYPAITVC